MKQRIDHEAEEAARLKADAARTAVWSSASYEPCPFCGTQPLSAQMQGVWCNNDNCAIVGVVFSGGPRHWNKRASPAQAQLFEAVTPQVRQEDEPIGAVLAYDTKGHNKVCGQTIGANGAGEFVRIFHGTTEQADAAARAHIRELERAGHRFTSVILVHNEDSYHGPAIRHVAAA